jgi:two-component system cell cycle response regulator
MVHDDENTNAEEKTVIASGETFKKQMPAADQAPPVLVVLLGPTAYQGKQFALADGHVVGRANESKIYIDDRSLSRSHARIDMKGNEVTVVDLGSTNKTVVNGQVLAPRAASKL